MKLIDGSLRNSTAVIVGMLLTLLFGYLAFKRIPIELNPVIDAPYITVETSYPGAAATEVEQEITRRQEEMLAAVENLREMRSASQEGMASISLKFDWGVDKNLAGLDVLKKLNLVEDLPDDAEEPQILTVDRFGERPFMWIYLKSDLPVKQMRQIVDDTIEPQLERVEGLAQLNAHGGAEREIRVLVDVEALNARQLTLNEVATALARENRNVRGGNLDQQTRRLIVRTVGQYESLDQILETVVKRTAAGPVRVRDIATVEDTTKDVDVNVRVGGRPSIAMGLIKKTGANTLKVAELAKVEIVKLNKALKPRGVEIQFAYDAAEYIWESIYQVRDSLIWGAILATAVLWFFLRSVTATLIVGVTIPLCMVGTFALLAAFGRSINVISLAGLGFASGMIVDAGIVVVENVYHHRAGLHKPILIAARDAALEVWAPIVASTLTTMAVFLPILFIQEEAGQLFRDIAYSISFAVGLSMLTAITVVPMLASRLLGRVQPGGRRLEDKNWLHRQVDPVTDWIGHWGAWIFYWPVLAGLRSRMARWLIIGLIFAGFGFSLLLAPPAEYLPTGNQNFIFGMLKTPSGLSLTGSEQLMSQLERRVLSLPELERTFFVVLREMPIFGAIIKKDQAQKENIQRIANELTGFAMSCYPFPDVIPIINQMPVFARGLGSGKTVTIDIRGPNLAKLEELTNRTMGQIRALPGVKSVRPLLDMNKPELRVYPDRERLADLGLTGGDVADLVETLVEGRITSKYREGGKEYDLKLKALEGDMRNPRDLANALLVTPGGGKIKLADVARLDQRMGPVKIERLEQERVSSVEVGIAEETPMETVIGEINAQVVGPMLKQLPLEYRIDLSGSADDLARTIAALRGSFALALIIIYLLMAALFRSFFYPFIIMFSVPLSMTGAYLGVKLTGAEFNVITMLGFILLAGVVVNNAILLVDMTLVRVREGASRADAIMDGVRRRLRPIFMTSITSVLGMAPLAMGQGAGAELYQGLGAAVLGGLTLSTLFTLILIPLLLYIFMGLRDGLAHRLGREDLTEAGRAKALAALDEEI